jgi:hypothetical protein
MNKTITQLRKQGIVTLVVLILALALSINIALAPSGTTAKTNLEFRWIGFSKTIMIDDNPEFTSPVTLKENQEATLEPGDYYWKTTGLSTTNSFKINSEVGIIVRRVSNDSFNIENTGNVNEVIETRTDFGITGAVTLDQNQNLNQTITENSTFLAQQNE